jgi:hypothetical protein
MKRQAEEIAKKSEIEQRKKDKAISAQKEEVNNLRTNDQLLTVMNEKLEIKNKAQSNAYSKLQEANEKLKKRVQQYNKNVCQQKRRKQNSNGNGRKKGTGEKRVESKSMYSKQQQ